jgi:RNA polymerase primary sigma factor
MPPPLDTFGTYLRDIGRYSLLTREQERKLGRRIRGGDEEAVHQLVAANLRFAVNMANRHARPGHPLEDLVSEGTLGLYEAARRFDERKGFRFISYAVWWIRRNVNRVKERDGHVVRVPARRFLLTGKVQRAQDRLEQELERPPRREEIARAVGASPERVDAAFATLRAASGTSTDAGEVTGEDRLARLADSASRDPGERVETEQRDRDVREAVASLGEREREIVDLYYGLSAGERLTLSEIGKRFGLSKERIRQLKKRALHRLRSGRLREHLPDPLQGAAS